MADIFHDSDDGGAEGRRSRGDQGAGPALLAFLAGAVVGAGLALLLAPRPGSDVRRQLRDSLAGQGEALRRRIEEAFESGKETARREVERLAREWGATGGPSGGPMPPGSQPPGRQG
jgi:hypothetical protein